MITIVASKTFPVAAWPRKDVNEYTFWARSHGGPRVGLNIDEYEWTLQVDSRSSSLVLEHFRPDADTPGMPIGVFRLGLSDDDLREIDALIQDAKLPQLKAEMHEHPGYSETIFNYRRPPSTMYSKLVNHRDFDALGKISPLMNKINAMVAIAVKAPERAVTLGIRHMTDPAGDRFEVTITNIGNEPVCFTDPRWVLPAGLNQRAVVKFAEYPETGPKDPPPFIDWKDLPLQPIEPRPKDEPLVVLEPGKVWSGTTVAWRNTKGKRYVAYATVANYVGEPIVNSTYRIRGQMFSTRLVLKP